MSTVSKVLARQIFDSRGNPTVEVEVTTPKGVFRASVPSGVTTTIHEGFELRDGDFTAYMGKGVLKAVANVNDILGPKLIAAKIPVTEQKKIDDFLISIDGTINKGTLGANAILGISLAVAKAAAEDKGLPLYAYFAELSGSKKPYVLPVPAFNLISGGYHAGNRLAFQEFMILPTGAKSFTEAMKIGTEVYHTLQSVIKAKYGLDATNVTDEGGFAPNIQKNEEALDLLVEAIEKAGYTGKVKIALNVAATEFHRKGGLYDLDFKNPNSDKSKWLDTKEITAFYKSLVEKYPIVSIEDPYDQYARAIWGELNAQVDYQLVGGELLLTKPKRVGFAKNNNSCNALLFKLNQIGSVSQGIEAALEVEALGWGVMVAHRAGETEDTFIADLVVGLRAGQIKAGAPCRSDRVAKYNQLLRIEEEIGEGNYIYAGENFRKAYLL